MIGSGDSLKGPDWAHVEYTWRFLSDQIVVIPLFGEGASVFSLGLDSHALQRTQPIPIISKFEISSIWLTVQIQFRSPSWCCFQHSSRNWSRFGLAYPSLVILVFLIFKIIKPIRMDNVFLMKVYLINYFPILNCPFSIICLWKFLVFN